MELQPTINPNNSNTGIQDVEQAENQNHQGPAIPVLPPTDEGPQAWRFLFGSFIIEAILWGFPMAFGVFQEHYSRQPEFSSPSSQALVPVIGTVATGLYFLAAPLASPLFRLFPRFQRHAVALGSLVCSLSLGLASLSATAGQLVATQGALYSLGFLALYMNVLSMLDGWFVRRRGLAYAVLAAGGGVSGVVVPFLLERLLSAYGFRTTLRAVAVAQVILVGPILPFMRGRLPPSHRAAVQRVDLRFFRHPLFWVFALSNVCQGLAFYIPPLYMPTYASAVGLSGTVGALMVSAFNLASVLGQLSFGHMSDRSSNIYMLIFASTFGAAVATFTLWGFAHSLAPLLAFAIVYGWTAGAYSALWIKFGSLVSEDPHPVFTLMLFGKGIGNIAAGPISARLLTGSLSIGSYGLHKFEPAIIFVGSLMLCSSLGVIGWPLKRLCVMPSISR